MRATHISMRGGGYLESFLFAEDIAIGGGDIHRAITYGSDLGVTDLASGELSRRHRGEKLENSR